MSEVVDRCVSVVMPVRLQGSSGSEVDWLLSAIWSVVRQDYDALQIVLVNDQSSYSFVELVQDILAGYEHVELTVVQGWGRGLVSALNRGLAHCRHPWIARLDCDDRWTEGKLATQFAMLNAHPECTLCFGGMILIDDRGSPKERLSRGMDWSACLMEMVRGVCPIPHSSILARRDVFSLLGRYRGSLEAVACEDLELWKDWARFFPVAGVEQYVLEYRIHTGSVSSQHSDVQGMNTRLVVDRLGGLKQPSAYTQAIVHYKDWCGTSFLEVGRAFYEAWAFGGALQCSQELIDPLRHIFFDRVLTVEKSGLGVVAFVDRL